MYTSKITRESKGAFILLIDLSGSMQEKTVFQGREMRKADAVTVTTNMFIDELVNRCRREDGVRDYFDIAVLGYHDDRVESLLGDTIRFHTTRQLVMLPVETIHVNIERRLPGGNTMLIDTSYHSWTTPVCKGNTPMLAALEQAARLADKWCRAKEHSKCYPPIVIDITDGDATDGDGEMLREAADKLKRIHTDDGNVLSVNIHISAQTTAGKGIRYPSDISQIGEDPRAELLWELSSELPAGFNAAVANGKSEDEKPPYRAMCYNCSTEDLIGMLSVGSSNMETL